MEKTVNLDNLVNAYRYKTDKEVFFTYRIYRLLENSWMVRVLGSAAKAALRFRLPVSALIRNTVYRVFCAGESIGQAFDTIHRLRRYRVKAVLDYVAEDENSEAGFLKNKEIILSNIKKLGTERAADSVSIKLSSLESNDFFRRINGVRWDVSGNDQHRLSHLLDRLIEICAAARDADITLYIDAEHSDTQDIFDSIAEQMMETFNTQKAIVYNTLQMYLRNRADYLKNLLTRAKQKGYYPGIKLVRGAYVEQERESSRQRASFCPVFDTKEETDSAFNDAIETCLRNHAWVYTCVASHNEKSNLVALAWIDKLQISDHREKVTFSQLYGMRDNITFNLAAAGYSVSKYLPYGEVRQAIPYLLRRAEENSSIKIQLRQELSRLQDEIRRRRNRFRRFVSISRQR